MSKIFSEGVYYLYRHIRLDKNEPFYVGIGTVSKTERLSTDYRYFRRAFSVSRRNTIWKRIVEKTDYEVEILLESDDYEFIKQKEIEFIALYGRKDLGKGSLANLTDGGENCGSIRTEEAKQKQREYWKNNIHPCKGVPRTEESKQKMREACKGRGKGELNYFYGKSFTGKDHPSSKPVINTETGVIYVNIKEAAEKEGYNHSTLKSKLNGNSKNDTNLIHYKTTE